MSGDDDLTVTGNSVSGVGEVSGTVRLSGQFSEIPFTTTTGGSDSIFFQVGRPRPSAPVNVVRPQVSGTASPGKTLACTAGDWTGSSAGLQYTYTWERAPRATRFEDDQAWGPFDGASGTAQTSYTVQDIDLGSRVRCRVTRSDEGGVDDAASRSMRMDSDASGFRPLTMKSATPATRPPRATLCTCRSCCARYRARRRPVPRTPRTPFARPRCRRSASASCDESPASARRPRA